MADLNMLKIKLKRPVQRSRLRQWEGDLKISIPESSNLGGRVWNFQVMVAPDSSTPIRAKATALCKLMAGALHENAEGAEAWFGRAKVTERSTELDIKNSQGPFSLRDGPPSDGESDTTVSLEYLLGVRNQMEDSRSELQAREPESPERRLLQEARLDEIERLLNATNDLLTKHYP